MHNNPENLDILCRICKGTLLQMNSDYEEVPCWGLFHDADVQNPIREFLAKRDDEQDKIWQLNKEQHVRIAVLNELRELPAHNGLDTPLRHAIDHRIAELTKGVGNGQGK